MVPVRVYMEMEAGSNGHRFGAAFWRSSSYVETSLPGVCGWKESSWSCHVAASDGWRGMVEYAEIDYTGVSLEVRSIVVLQRTEIIWADDVQYAVVGFNEVQRAEMGLLERLHHAEFAGELYYVSMVELAEADCSGFLKEGASYVHHSRRWRC